MKYVKDKELKELLLSHESIGDIELLRLKLEPLMEGMERLLSAASSTGLHVDSLKIILSNFYKIDDVKFEGLCQKTLEHAKRHGQTIEDQAVMFCRVLGSVRDFLKKEQNKTILNIFSGHIEDVLKRLQEDKKKDLGLLLYKKALKDGQALRAGKPWDPSESESYKLFKKIQKKNI